MTTSAKIHQDLFRSMADVVIGHYENIVFLSASFVKLDKSSGLEYTVAA